MPHPLAGPALGFAARLKFPTLFKITVVLFVIDLLVPDIIPFIDEILMGLTALILANWRNPEVESAPPADESKVIEGQSRRQ